VNGYGSKIMNLPFRRSTGPEPLPDYMQNLVDTIGFQAGQEQHRRPGAANLFGTPGDKDRAQAELMARMALASDRTARALTRATYALVVATLLLVVVDVVSR
jgi:hypothetical protein